MFASLKELLGSKKLWLAVVGSAVVSFLAAVLPAFGLSTEIVQQVLFTVGGFFGVGIAGQGMADFGKEKAKIEAGQK